MAKIIRRTPKQVYKRWLKALRSGEYAQGTSYLKWQYRGEKKAEFCCLGVLCDLAARDGGPEWKGHNKLGSNTAESYMGHTVAIPPDMRFFLAMNQAEVNHLIDMNDEFANNFGEIATYIENVIMKRIFK